MKITLILCWVLGLVAIGCSTHTYKVGADFVELLLINQRASQVQFACSLDQFAVRQTRHLGHGKWAVTVSGSHPFRYFYLVDGKIYLPDCRLKETDDLGSENCIYQPGM
jgi:hypothetical protein